MASNNVRRQKCRAIQNSFRWREKCSSENLLGHWANSCSCFAIRTGAIHHIRLEILWARHYLIEVKCENQRQVFHKYWARDETGSCTGLDSVDMPPECMPQMASLTYLILQKADLHHSIALISHPGAFILFFPALSALCVYLYQRYYGASTAWKLFQSGLKYSVHIPCLRNREI